MALVVLEAMAMGKPVIITPNCGYNEIIEDGKEGFIIPIRDIEVIKENLIYFHDNKSEVNKMGRNARKTSEQYTWKRYQDTLIRTVQEII